MKKECLFTHAWIELNDKMFVMFVCVRVCKEVEDWSEFITAPYGGIIIQVSSGDNREISLKLIVVNGQKDLQ
jgi:hypothetical protein